MLHHRNDNPDNPAHHPECVPDPDAPCGTFRCEVCERETRDCCVNGICPTGDVCARCAEGPDA
jgi:hypothetical protein